MFPRQFVPSRLGVMLLVLLATVSSPIRGACQPLQAARPELDLQQWAAKIRAGWVGKVAAGSGALPTEMWPKERIQEKYVALIGPPQKPTSRGPLDETTLALLGWQTAREHGPDFTTAQIAQGPVAWEGHLQVLRRGSSWNWR